MVGDSSTRRRSLSYRLKGDVMEYRNKKTGVVIDVKSELRGDWEPVKAEKKSETKKAPKKAEAKKK